MRMLVKLAFLLCGFSPLCNFASAGVLFTDNFGTNGSDSPPWGNQRGNWSASGGVYSAAVPSAGPITYSSLTSYDLTDFSFQVDVNDISDGGLWLRSDFNGGNVNGVLLVLGGGGYGSGVRVGSAGHEIYWHVVHNGVAGVAYNAVGGAFNPGDNATIRVDVEGDTFKAYINGALATTLVDNTFSHGQVGLYDFYSGLSFDNAELSTVPEPSTLTIFGIALAGLGFSSSRKAALALSQQGVTYSVMDL